MAAKNNSDSFGYTDTKQRVLVRQDDAHLKVFKGKMRSEKALAALTEQLSKIKEIPLRCVFPRNQAQLITMCNALYEEYANCECDILTTIQRVNLRINPPLTLLELQWRRKNDPFLREYMDDIKNFFKEAIEGMIIKEALTNQSVMFRFFDSAERLKLAEINRTAIAESHSKVESITINVARDALIEDANTRVNLTETKINKLE